MFKQFIINPNGRFDEPLPSQCSSYKVYLQNKELGKLMTEAQRKDIMEKLSKQRGSFDFAGMQGQKESAPQQELSATKSSLYKMNLGYILN